ncbi:MAG: hypothetical protein V4622_12225 [Bacteroidota bacterium]
MKKLIFTLFTALSVGAFSQSKELTFTVKSFEILESNGTQSPFIDYVDINGKEQRFWFELPAIEKDKYPEITIGEALLIKVGSTFDYGSFVLIETYDFHEDVAKSLLGKKIKITYEAVELKAYLYSINIIN